MALTTREICDRYARMRNLEEDPAALCELLHPEAVWVTKIGTRSSGATRERWWTAWHARRRAGLRSIELPSGHRDDAGERVECTASIPIGNLDKHDLRTYFHTDGTRITMIFSYVEWLDRTWPHPARAAEKITELRARGIEVRPAPGRPAVLTWPTA